MMRGRLSQQARKREMACVRNKLFSLVRIGCKESQRATTVTSGDSGLAQAKARTARCPPCRRPSQQREEKTSWSLHRPGTNAESPNASMHGVLVLDADEYRRTPTTTEH